MVNSAATRDLLAELPRIRTQLRQGRVPHDVALRRLVRLIDARTPTAVAGLLESAGVTLPAVRTAWLAGCVCRAAAVITPTRRVAVAAGLLADLDDDPQQAAALTLGLKRWPSSVPRLIRQQRERIDGTGEPSALTARSLSLASQTLALACEASRRLAAGDPVDAGQAVLALRDEAADGQWGRSLVDCLLVFALPLASVAREATEPRPLLRIDAAHPPVVVQAESRAEARRHRRLTGLRASRERGVRFSKAGG